MGKKNEVKKLLEVYGDLTESEQSVIELASLIYEPFDKIRFFRCVRQAGIKDDRRMPFVPSTWNALIDSLCQQELLVLRKDKLVCNPLVVEYLTEIAVQFDSIDFKLASIRELFPLSRMGFYQAETEVERCKREVRLGIYMHDFNHVNNTLKIGRRFHPDQIHGNNMFYEICNMPFRKKWFMSLPLIMQLVALDEIVYTSIYKLEPLDDVIDALREYRDNPLDQYGRQFRDLLATCLVFKGEFEEARSITKDYPESGNALARIAWVDFYQGDTSSALDVYESALNKYRSTNENKKAYFGHVSGIFFILALLKQQELYNYSRLLEFISYAEESKNPFILSYQALKALIFALKNKYKGAKSQLQQSSQNSDDAISHLFLSVVKFWIFPDEFKKTEPLLIEQLAKALDGDYPLLALEYASLLEQLVFENEEYTAIRTDIEEKLGVKSILPIIEQKEHWEKSTASQAFQSQTTDFVDNVSMNSRLIWLINFETFEFTAKEQKISTSGGWTKGRSVSLKKIKSMEVESMTPQDIHIADAIEVYLDDKGLEVFSFNTENALLALSGHPLLFFAESPNVNVELRKKGPELHVRRDGENFEIGFNFDIDNFGMHLIRETPTRYALIDIDDDYRTIYEILGGPSITVSKEEKAKILNQITESSDIVTVQSVVGLDAEVFTDVETDTLIHVHLLPIGKGFKLEFFVRPFGNDGPYFKPGTGQENLVMKLGDSLVQTARNLDLEVELSDGLIQECPSLENQDQDNFEWLFEEPEDCLGVLLQLDSVKENIVIEWPKGERLKVRKSVSAQNLYLKVRSNEDWFSVDGELKVDDSTVLSMQKILDAVDGKKSNFIELGKGEFVAITDDLRSQIEELKSLAEIKKNGEIDLNPLAALAFESLSETFDHIEFDDEWKKHLDSIDNALHEEPEVPAGLNAELRNYQVDGFKWMNRLASWGVGACLADDMGLGKTIQAITTILHRSDQGPALIMAPASVCINWELECRKFAPELNPILFGGRSREKVLAALSRGDVLICSYGLLQQESKLLSELLWSTIVLDEAQAIKNVATKRSRAAMKLNGGFRLITTGTPVQNHLGELWNLFNFINPGLLGSLDHFRTKYSGPIEKFGDDEARDRLRKLIGPFVLRRTKDQVLGELPEKTEITLSIQLSEEEKAFYEALRRRAVMSLDTDEAPEGQRHIKILAEIMRLRRACCHSRLVTSDSEIESSKLTEFLKIVDELLENNHKALVFSQFVSHLDLIREELDKREVKYQYLDGSTPVRDRQSAIDAFQKGEGDLFLISLKAGGFGLNLTEADYVIHMDPWWNPAVEDQATDRAHRIGQKKPVTIYRLVTSGTIEEKIVKLHQGKRELADSILEGADTSGKVSAEELLSLIKES